MTQQKNPGAGETARGAGDVSPAQVDISQFDNTSLGIKQHNRSGRDSDTTLAETRKPSTLTIIDRAHEYMAHSWSPIPIPFRKKGPDRKGWDKFSARADKLHIDFRSPCNIGVLLGSASDGLTDVDLDCSEARSVASATLPPTDACFGRLTSPRSHYLYKTDLGKTHKTARITFEDPTNGSMLLEVRIGGNGGTQTVFPGSTHEDTGELIEWDRNGQPKEVDGTVLLRTAAICASLSLLIRYWPTEGSRHDAAFCLGGFFARFGKKFAHDAPALVEHIAALAGDTDELEDRRRAASDAVERYQNCKPSYGLPRLRIIFGDKQANAIAKWLEYESENPISDDGSEIIKILNDKYCVVDIEGKNCVVAFRKDDGGQTKAVYYKFEAFKGLNDHVKIGRQGAGSWWLSHPERRQYEGITFAPGKKGTVPATPGLLNLWRGFSIPSRRGDWSLMERHVDEVLASGNAQHALYIKKWLAWSVQNPGERAESVLVFKSDEEGSGKGTLGNAMTRMFDAHGLRVDRHEHLTGKFNAHLQAACFLFADEAFWPGDKSAEGVLKGLVTEPTRMIEPKGINPYVVKNCLHIMMASNNAWTVPAGPSARRFAVFRVSPHRVGDKEWFGAIFEQLDKGGREAMLFDLINMDLGSWHPRDNVPKTSELLVEKTNTLSPEQKWLLSLLSDGRLPSYRPLPGNECVTQYLYENYITHAGRTGARHRAIEVQIGKFLKDTLPGLRKVERRYKEKGHEKRGNAYLFPPLTQCRQAFNSLLQQDWPWEGPDVWAEPEDDDESEDCGHEF